VWGKVRAWQRVAISGLAELSYGNVVFGMKETKTERWDAVQLD
jgi:hypothetical protein